MAEDLKCLRCGYDLSIDFVSDPGKNIVCLQCHTEYEIDSNGSQPHLKPRKWIVRLRLFLHI
jgi:hypothetical protein